MSVRGKDAIMRMRMREDVMMRVKMRMRGKDVKLRMSMGEDEGKRCYDEDERG